MIEDVSHAQGGLYKGKKLGTFGDVAAMSMMAQKSLSAGEGGMLVTDHTRYFERALAYGHYSRNNAASIHESEEIKPYFGLPLGGVKARLNQVSAAIGRAQLKYYDERCAEIRKAMNYFWDLLEDVPGIRAIRVDESTGSNMAGFYAASGTYIPEELHGLSVKKFCEAVRSEVGNCCWDGGNFCLHTHQLFQTFDFRNSGKPSTIEYMDDTRYTGADGCDQSIDRYMFSVPWFKKYNKEWIERYASAFRKVAENHMQLIEQDNNDAKQTGRWFGFENEG